VVNEVESAKSAAVSVWCNAGGNTCITQKNVVFTKGASCHSTVHYYHVNVQQNTGCMHHRSGDRVDVLWVVQLQSITATETTK
jgi:hypothetical protein